jgi:hypothetical protein
MHQCNACYNDITCPVCIFYLDLEHPTCPEFQREEKSKRHLADSMSLLEETPRYYPRIMKDYQTE